MRRLAVWPRVAALVLLISMSASCSQHYFNVYRSEISQNQQNLQRVQLGMTQADVRSIMGEGEIVRYRAIHLVDPWRNESFQIKDGSTVVVLYYVTQPPKRFNPPSNRETTPIVFEADKVVGWGWSFLRQNLDRYQISSPKDQL
jgi:hypothetical protein